MQSFKFKRVALSDTSLMEQIFRLRYQVYGHERRFITPEDYPDGLETDEYDEHATHVAAINRFGEVIGAMRIIFNRTTVLPIERKVEHINLAPPDPGILSFAEISRLVISKQLRQRYHGHLHQIGARQMIDSSQKSFLRFARPLALGLCHQAHEESKDMGITHWLCLMERGLHSLLQMYGLSFCCIGNEVECMGKVSPYIAHVHSIESALTAYFGKTTPNFLTPAFSLS